MGLKNACRTGDHRRRPRPVPPLPAAGTTLPEARFSCETCPTGKVKTTNIMLIRHQGQGDLAIPDDRVKKTSIIVRNTCHLSTCPALPASCHKAKQGRGSTTTLSISIKIQISYTSLTMGTTTGSRSRTRRKKRRNEARMPSCRRVSWPGRTDSISSSTRHLASSST